MNKAFDSLLADTPEDAATIPQHNDKCKQCLSSAMAIKVNKVSISNIAKAIRSVSPVIYEIQDSQKEIVRTLTEVNNQIAKLNTQLEKADARIEAIEDKIEDIEDRVEKLNEILKVGDGTELNPGLIKSVAEHNKLVLQVHSYYQIIAWGISIFGSAISALLYWMATKLGNYISILELHLKEAVK